MVRKSLRLIGANREPEALDPQLFEREFQSRIGCRKRTNIVGIVFQEYGNGSCDQFLRRISVKRQSCIQQRARAVAGKGAHEHRLDSRPAKDFQRMIERSNEIGSRVDRSEEHTPELQSVMRISYAVSFFTTKNTEN